jgi:hypothetical protein
MFYTFDENIIIKRRYFLRHEYETRFQLDIQELEAIVIIIMEKLIIIKK